jgi:hypothetical protein
MAWFGLLDFKVLLLEKPGGAPIASFSENKGERIGRHGQSLCSRNAHDQNVLVRRPHLGLAMSPCNEHAMLGK